MKWYLHYENRDWLFDDARVTAHEQRVMKRITEGMTPVEIDAKRMQGDPDVWLAMLVVARERAGLDPVQAAQVDDRRFVVDDCLDATTLALKESSTVVNGADVPDAPKARPRTRSAKPADKPAEEPSAA